MRFLHRIIEKRSTSGGRIFLRRPLTRIFFMLRKCLAICCTWAAPMTPKVVTEADSQVVIRLLSLFQQIPQCTKAQDFPAQCTTVSDGQRHWSMQVGSSILFKSRTQMNQIPSLLSHIQIPITARVTLAPIAAKVPDEPLAWASCTIQYLEELEIRVDPEYISSSWFQKLELADQCS
jgi:hypothetical protein